jgi:hypothetical protein
MPSPDSSIPYFQLCNLTAHKIEAEASKESQDLRRLVLLWETYDMQTRNRVGAIHSVLETGLSDGLPSYDDLWQKAPSTPYISSIQPWFQSGLNDYEYDGAVDGDDDSSIDSSSESSSSDEEDELPSKTHESWKCTVTVSEYFTEAEEEAESYEVDACNRLPDLIREQMRIEDQDNNIVRHTEATYSALQQCRPTIALSKVDVETTMS